MTRAEIDSRIDLIIGRKKNTSRYVAVGRKKGPGQRNRGKKR